MNVAAIETALVVILAGGCLLYTLAGILIWHWKDIRAWIVPILCVVVFSLAQIPDNGSFSWQRPPLWEEILSVIIGTVFVWGMVELLREERE